MQFLGLAFLILVVIEILSIILMIKLLGGLAVWVLMILSFMLGLFILRRTAGFAKVLMAGELLRGQGGISFYQMMWPIRIPVAGVLLMLPGFASTLGAIILLLPFKGQSLSQQQGASGNASFGGFEFGKGTFRHARQEQYDDDIIEGEFTIQSGNRSQTKQQKHIDVIEHQKS